MGAINADGGSAFRTGVGSPAFRAAQIAALHSLHRTIAVRSHHRPVQPLAWPPMRSGTVALPYQRVGRGIVLVTRARRGAAYLFGRLLAFPSRTPFAGVLLG